MYPFLLTLHSLLRWVVVILGVIAVVRGFMGWRGNRPWTQTDNRVGLGFVTSLDVQLLIGFLLYVVFSPMTTAALRDFGGAMGNSVLRFYAVEHLFGMVVALVVAHVGRSLARRDRPAAAKHRLAALFFLAALLIIFISIPWPFMPAGAGRPWFRLG